jgi:hypothetical protein
MENVARYISRSADLPETNASKFRSLDTIAAWKLNLPVTYFKFLSTLIYLLTHGIHPPPLLCNVFVAETKPSFPFHRRLREFPSKQF